MYKTILLCCVVIASSVLTACGNSDSEASNTKTSDNTVAVLGAEVDQTDSANQTSGRAICEKFGDSAKLKMFSAEILDVRPAANQVGEVCRIRSVDNTLGFDLGYVDSLDVYRKGFDVGRAFVGDKEKLYVPAQTGSGDVFSMAVIATPESSAEPSKYLVYSQSPIASRWLTQLEVEELLSLVVSG